MKNRPKVLNLDKIITAGQDLSFDLKNVAFDVKNNTLYVRSRSEAKASLKKKTAIHWTQRPENKAKLSKIAKKGHLSRRG